LNLPHVGTPSIEWCSKGVFPHMGDSRVYIELSRKITILLLVLFQQQETTVLCLQQTGVFIRHSQLARFIKINSMSKDFFGIFKLIRIENKTTNKDSVEGLSYG
jgi:hypothetical protein